MSPKIIYTRISSKYDEYDNWLREDPILLQGEFAVAVDPNNTDSEHPVILVKVGDGIHKYSELPFISSNALDVPEWAKANTKPVYTAEEIVGLDKYINNGGTPVVPPNTGDGTTPIVDTNTQYDIIKVDDWTYQLVAKNIGDTEYTKISTIDIPKYPATEPTVSGPELVTEEGSGIILTNLEDNKVSIAIDTSILENGSGSTDSGKDITTPENSGIKIVESEDNISISLDKTITYLLNGGTSTNI